jgi:hypothetical protein
MQQAPGDLLPNGPPPAHSPATWPTRHTRSSLAAGILHPDWSNKRQRLHTYPCGLATVNPSHVTPHRSNTPHTAFALTAPLANAPASRGLSTDCTSMDSTATTALIAIHDEPLTPSTKGRRLWLGSGASIAIGGGGSGNLFPSHLSLHLQERADPPSSG